MLVFVCAFVCAFVAAFVCVSALNQGVVHTRAGHQHDELHHMHSVPSSCPDPIHGIETRRVLVTAASSSSNQSK